MEYPQTEDEKRISWVLDNFGYKRFGDLISNRIRQLKRKGIDDAMAREGRNVDQLVIPETVKDEMSDQTRNFIHLTFNQTVEKLIDQISETPNASKLSIEEVWRRLNRIATHVMRGGDPFDCRSNDWDDRLAGHLFEFVTLYLASLAIEYKPVRKALNVKVPFFG